VKLATFRHRTDDTERFGAVLGDSIIDLTGMNGHQSLLSLIDSDDFEKRDSLVSGGTPIAIADVEFLPVIPRPEKIICAVRNYMDHHKEAVAAGLNRQLTDCPPIFFRVWRSQIGHDQPIVRPRASDTLDWEGELAVVIGRSGRDIPESEAWAHVAGYSCYNDASIREFQFHAQQIAAGKNFESTGAFGPWMVTTDEIAPGQTLTLQTRLNGEIVQSGDTGLMIFNIPQLIAYASTVVTLVPGDVIVTGTPAGVGFSRKPPRFMKPGDVVEVEIEAIGVLRNPIVQQD